MAMSPEAQAEYDKALTAVVLRNGQIVREQPSIYMWTDYNVDDHARSGCPLTTTGPVRETDWDEFMGTFYEGDTTVHGVSVFGVSCACGVLQYREMRWAGSVSEVAEAVFNEAFGQRGQRS